MTRILAIGDLHCGHKAGLTPPKYQFHPSYKDTQSRLWDWYAATVAEIKPDVLFVLGDAVDGRGQRNGGVEQFLPSMEDQAACAVECIKAIGASRIVMVYGTPYHVAPDGVDWERRIAEDCGGTIHDHAMVDVDGVRFSLKHKIGSSSVPHGRATALLRDALWDVLWASEAYEDRRRADVILRGHVHYHSHAGNTQHLAMTLPCLQMSSDYGARQCQGVIDYGMVSFDCEGGNYSWKRHIAKLHSREIVSP